MSETPSREFTKYRQLGAYHWQWYKTNKYSYRDYAHRTISYFETPGSMLDVGCGDGVLSYLFFQEGFDVTGLDTDVTSIKLGRQAIARSYTLKYPFKAFASLFQGGIIRYLDKKGVRLLSQSVLDLSKSRTYDYAICMEVIEHVSDPRLFVEKIFGLIKKFVIFSTPNGDFHRPGKLDNRFWKPQEFIDFLGTDRADLIHVDEQRIFAKLKC